MLKSLSSMTLFRLSGTIAIYIYQTSLTHLLSTKEYGVFANWLTDFGFLGVFFVLGLDSSLLYHGKKVQHYEENMGKNIVVYFLMFFLSLIAVFSFGLDKAYFVTLFIAILSFAIVSVIRSYFQYKENLLLFNILANINAYILLIIYLAYFIFKMNLNINYALLTQMMSALIVLVIAYVIYSKYSNIKFVKITMFKDSGYFTYGLKSIMNSTLSLSLYASTIYCLKFLDGYEGVAYFFVASSISKFAWILPDSAGNILYPRFLKIGRDYSKEQVFKEMFFYGQVIFVLNIIAVLAFYLLGEFLITLFYENTYIQIFLPVIILLIGNQGMVYYKILSRYFASINNWQPLYISLILGIVTNISLNFLLIPSYKIIGASIATSLSFLICGISLCFHLKSSVWEFINIFSLFNKIVNKKLNA